jgi:hypothetical protein
MGKTWHGICFQVTIDHGIPQNCSLFFLNGENDDEPGGIRQLAFTPILGYKWLQVSALNLTGMYQGMYGVVSRFRTLKFTESRAVSADFNQHFFFCDTLCSSLLWHPFLHT